jgi:hypothetical protein
MVLITIWEHFTDKDRKLLCEVLNYAQNEVQYHEGMLGIADVEKVMNILALYKDPHSFSISKMMQDYAKFYGPVMAIMSKIMVAADKEGYQITEVVSYKLRRRT